MKKLDCVQRERLELSADDAKCGSVNMVFSRPQLRQSQPVASEDDGIERIIVGLADLPLPRGAVIDASHELFANKRPNSMMPESGVGTRKRAQELPLVCAGK